MHEANYVNGPIKWILPSTQPIAIHPESAVCQRWKRYILTTKPTEFQIHPKQQVRRFAGTVNENPPGANSTRLPRIFMLSIINKALKRPLFIELKKTHSESEEYENDNAVVINECENIKFCIPVKVVSSAEKLLKSLFDYLNY